MKSQLVKIASLVYFVLTLSPIASFAQEPSRSKGFMHNIHVGLIYPISNHGVNAGEYTNVFSVHAIAGLSQAEKGLSLAGVANIIKGEARGTQFAGVLNSYNTGRGLQLAGVLNIARQEVHGLQIAGVINKAGKVHGVQFAGVMNIADSSDYPIGIVNIIKNGSKSLGLSIDEDQTLLASFRSGGRVMYGIVGLGYNLQNSKQKYAFEAGMGAHLIAKNDFSLNLEISSVNLIDFDDHMYSKNSLRLLPAYKVSPNLEIYAGPSVAHIFTNSSEGEDMISNTIWRKTRDNGHTNAVGFGAIAGVQLYF